MNVKPHKRTSKLLEELSPGSVFFYQNRFLILTQSDAVDGDDLDLRALNLKDGVVEYIGRFELVELVDGEFVESWVK